MKKQLLFIILLLLAFNQIKAQCSGGSTFLTVNAPTDATVHAITSCNFAGDFNVINNCIAGASYTFTSSNSGFITIRQGSSTGTLVGFGTATVTITSPISGTLYMVIKSSPSCANANTCLSTTIKNDLVTLPVNFGKFNATLQSNRVKLDWNTLSETNNQTFMVYRSTDAIKYSEIAQQQSKGKSNNSYTAYDKSPVNGINYYRLKQQDNDGTVTVLADAVVNLLIASDEVKAWPNPADKLLNLSFSSRKYHSLKLLDVNGKTLQTKIITNTQNTAELDLSNYPKGVYVVKFLGDASNKSIKISKE